jgi:hypothetical protein
VKASTSFFSWALNSKNFPARASGMSAPAETAFLSLLAGRLNLRDSALSVSIFAGILKSSGLSKPEKPIFHIRRHESKEGDS